MAVFVVLVVDLAVGLGVANLVVLLADGEVLVGEEP